MLPKRLWSAALFHYLCYIIMQTLALFAETRRGPGLDDLFHRWVPYVPWFSWFNTSFWLSGLLLAIAALMIFQRRLAVVYLVLGGMISLLRGLMIPITTLGAPKTIAVGDFMQNFSTDTISWGLLLKQWFPLDIFWGGSEHSAAFLTQDLFFSGHTASTFLLILVTKNQKKWQFIMIVFHVFTVISLLFTHLHYTIDIIAAYFIAYSVYIFFVVQKKWLTLEGEARVLNREPL